VPYHQDPNYVLQIDEDGPLLLIGVNRPEANNLWNDDHGSTY
jgi:hypothetical protein